VARLVACLVALREEFNRIAPTRDKESDGWIGDEAHQSGNSDHNPDANGNVHAIDVDKDLNTDFDMQDCVDYIISECRKSGESGKDKGRLKYVIYNRVIWEASNGWNSRPYTGSNPHDKHAHFSCEYAEKYAEDDSPWGLVERFGDMANQFLVKQNPNAGPTEEVKFWQYQLEWAGYDPGEIDGIFGSKMRAALDKWRKDRGQAVVDNITGWTAATMLKEMAQRYAGKPGTNGKDGAPGAPGKDGKDGADGTFSGTLNVVSGTLVAEDAS